MKRLIEWLSILGAIGIVAGFLSMNIIVLTYEHLPPYMRWPFMASVLVFFGSILFSIIMWLVGAWYARVQSRRERLRGMK